MANKRSWSADEELLIQTASGRTLFDRHTLMQTAEILVQRQWELMQTMAQRMLVLVLEGAAHLTPNHRLRDVAVPFFRYQQLNDLYDAARSLRHDNAADLFEQLFALYEEPYPRSFIPWWEAVQLREASAFLREWGESCAILPEGSSQSAEKLVEWRNLCALDKAGALNRRDAKKRDVFKQEYQQVPREGVPVKVTATLDIKQNFREHDPTRIAQMVRRDLRATRE